MVLDQGEEGSCTGFGLAGVVNYLRWELCQSAGAGEQEEAHFRSVGRISARMLYHNARLYDEWKGEDYEGSSCRGAMKGLHKHGGLQRSVRGRVSRRAASRRALPGWDVSAPLTPLGAYYRIDGKSIVDMQSAIFETHAIYVSADVHDGWDRSRKTANRSKPPRSSRRTIPTTSAVTPLHSSATPRSAASSSRIHGARVGAIMASRCCPMRTGPDMGPTPGR